MKKKLGTVIEADLLRRVKRRAADEGRPLNELIQDAPARYLAAGLPSVDQREAAYRLFCEQPMRISDEDFREILQTDVWKQ